MVFSINKQIEKVSMFKKDSGPESITQIHMYNMKDILSRTLLTFSINL